MGVRERPKRFPARKRFVVHWSMRRRFLLLVAIPVALLTLLGSQAFTFSQAGSALAADLESVNYVVPASADTAAAGAYMATARDLGGQTQSEQIAAKNSVLPQWLIGNTTTCSLVGYGGVKLASSKLCCTHWVKAAKSSVCPAHKALPRRVCQGAVCSKRKAAITFTPAPSTAKLSHIPPLSSAVRKTANH